MEKIIDVWVPKEIEQFDRYMGIYIHEKDLPKNHHWMEAKLIIEMPEKKAEITESEFKSIPFILRNREEEENYIQLRDKLFGDKR